MAPLDPHLIHGSLGPPESAPKWHLDKFSCLCTALLCDEHKQTTLRATCVEISRYTQCMRCGTNYAGCIKKQHKYYSETW